MPSSESPAGSRLAFAGLRRRFGRRWVLDGVSGSVASGEALLVRGPNGAGKSTLLRCLAGLTAVQAGTIQWTTDGATTGSASERRRAVGYLAPDVDYWADLDARENLQFLARLRRLELPRAALDDWLDGLDVPATVAWRGLSSGQRQRLRWVGALLHAPRLLLADEPFQNLDDSGRRHVEALLASHRAGGGVLVVASPVELELPGGSDGVRRLELVG